MMNRYFLFKYIVFLTIFLLSNRISHGSFLVEQERQTQQIRNAIKNLQPALKNNQERVEKLADAIWHHQKRTGVEWRIALAIMHQESSLRMDPQGCLKKRRHCDDMGIGQIRYSIWGKKLNIDKEQLLTNEYYAVGKVFEVLEYYKLRFANREFNWFTRYHSKTPEFRFKYMHQLNGAYKRFNPTKD